MHQTADSERRVRIAAVRSCFFHYLQTLHTPVEEDLPFCIGRPRSEQLPAQVVTLREFDELCSHSGWLSQLYMLQPYPQRLFEYIGNAVGKGRTVQALHDMLRRQSRETEPHFQTGAVTVRALSTVAWRSWRQFMYSCAIVVIGACVGPRVVDVCCVAGVCR